MLFNADKTTLVQFPLHKKEENGYYQVPDTVKVIGPHAFRGIYNDDVSNELAQVFLPTGVEEIGDYAFMDRDGLQTVNIPSSVTKLGRSAFNSLDALTTVNIDPDKSKLTTIPESAFWGAEKLTSFAFPKGLTSVGDNAFSTSGLTKIELPEGLTSIDNGAFNACFDLAEVKLPSTLKTIGDAAFAGDAAVTSLTLPEGLKTIGAAAFSNMYGIPSLEIPASVETLGEGFLSNHWNSDSKLTSVTFAKGSKITAIPAMAFANQYHISTITIPETVTSVGAGAFRDDSGLKSVIFLNRGEWDMDENAFYAGVASVTARLYGYTASSTKANADVAGLGFYPIDITQTTPLPNTLQATVGKEVQLQSEVTTENGELSYQWYVNGEKVDAAPSGPNKYAFTPDKAGAYTVSLEVTNSYDPDHPTTFSCVVTAEEAQPEIVFSDVPEGTWFHDSVYDAVKLGLVTGYADDSGNLTGLFGPYDQLTRAQAVAILARAVGAEGLDDRVENETPFADVASNEWYTASMNWAYKNGVINGYGPDFTTARPDGAITREELVVLVANVASYKGIDLAASDEAFHQMADWQSVDDWAVDSLVWAAANGVISGVDRDGARYVDPFNPTTRAETAAIAVNFVRDVLKK